MRPSSRSGRHAHSARSQPGPNSAPTINPAIHSAIAHGPNTDQIHAPAVYQATPHNALRLDAAAVDAPGMLRLRWTVLAAAQDAGAPEVYHLQARAAEGNASADLGVADCQPTHWQAGQTVFTWLSLAPATATSGPANTAPTTLPPSVALSVSASAPHLYTPMVGPLHLMSAHSIDDMPALLQPVPAPGEAPGSRPGSITANGSYVLPVQGTS